MTHDNIGHCSSCGQRRQFRHMHNTAHGLPGTHMAGSERFECCSCGETYFACDGAPFPLKFLLDVPASAQPATIAESPTDGDSRP